MLFFIFFLLAGELTRTATTTKTELFNIAICTAEYQSLFTHEATRGAPLLQPKKYTPNHMLASVNSLVPDPHP